MSVYKTCWDYTEIFARISCCLSQCSIKNIPVYCPYQMLNSKDLDKTIRAVN